MKAPRPELRDDARAPVRGQVTWLAALSAALVLLAYGGVLDNYFYEIDDALVLNGVVDRVVTPRFLPVHFAWNHVLYAVFGAHPAGYYAAGLLIHTLSATIVGSLVLRITRHRVPAGCAVAVFAVLYAPHEAVLWFTAACGLLSVFFALLATLAWDAYLLERRGGFYGIAIACALCAMGAKEDSVVLAPLLLGLDRLRNGPAWRRGFVRRYAVFALIGLTYAALVFRPGNWAGVRFGGSYGLSFDLVAKAVRNFALFLWPRTLPAAHVPPWALPAGAAILVALGLLAWRARRTSPLIAYGLVVALFGMLPVLPGPFPIIAQNRYAYPSTIGLALIAGGLVVGLTGVLRRLRPNASKVVAVGSTAIAVAWVAVQILAIRSIEGWRFETRAAHFQRAMESTRSVLAEAGAGGTKRAAILGPVVWDPHDYASGLRVFVGVPKERLTSRLLGVDDVLAELDDESWLSSNSTRVYVGEEDGSISAVGRRSELPIERWQRLAGETARRGFGENIGVVIVELPRER